MFDVEDLIMMEEFLKEYELLCQKYNMGLEGCGCCNSPYLNKIGDINYNSNLKQVFIGGKGFWHERYRNINECDKYDKDCYMREKTIEEYFKESE